MTKMATLPYLDVWYLLDLSLEDTFPPWPQCSCTKVLTYLLHEAGSRHGGGRKEQGDGWTRKEIQGTLPSLPWVDGKARYPVRLWKSPLKQCGMGKCNAWCPTLMARTASSNRTMHLPIPSSLTFSLIRHSPLPLSKLKKVVSHGKHVYGNPYPVSPISVLFAACLSAYPWAFWMGPWAARCQRGQLSRCQKSAMTEQKREEKKKNAFVNQPPTNQLSNPPYPTCQCSPLIVTLVVFPNCAPCPTPVHRPFPVCGMFGNFRANKNNLGVGSWPKISPTFAPFGPNSIAHGPGAPKA